MANLFVLNRQFYSSSVHIRHTNERLQNFIVKPSCSLKKKVNAGNQGAIRHRLATPDIARYKLWNIFHLKYFPQLQCATTNRPMHHAWSMRRRLATPELNHSKKSILTNKNHHYYCQKSNFGKS